jgi:multiple sugar transport system substrate-binding protein
MVAASFALAGCTAGEAPPTLRFQVAADGVEVDAYRALVDAFEAATPGVTVGLEAIASSGDHMDKLTADYAAGDPADVFLVNYRRFGQLARNGAIAPAAGYLDDVGVDLDDLYPQPVDAFRVDGELMCLPQNASSLAVYYNRTLFEDAGFVEPPEDWTWEQFVDVAELLTQDTDGDGATDIYGLATVTDLVRVAPFVWQAGGEVVDDPVDPTQITLLNDAGLRALGYFIGLRRDHLVAPSVEEAEAEDPETRFARGGAAMLLDSRRAAANLRAADGLEFDVAPLPHDTEHATVLHADAYCLAAPSDVKEQAQAFIGFAMSEEGQRLLSETGRIVPARKAVANSEAFLDPSAEPAHAQVWLDQLAYVRTLPNIAAWNEIESIAEPNIEEWFYGTEPVEALGIELDIATREAFTSAGP